MTIARESVTVEFIHLSLPSLFHRWKDVELNAKINTSFAFQVAGAKMILIVTTQLLIHQKEEKTHSFSPQMTVVDFQMILVIL